MDFQFDTLSNEHPVKRHYEHDPRNDSDYDTWDAGMEPLPGDRNWARHARMRAGMSPEPVVPTWKDNARPVENPRNG
jgi:hypothetical protein